MVSHKIIFKIVVKLSAFTPKCLEGNLKRGHACTLSKIHQRHSACVRYVKGNQEFGMEFKGPFRSAHTINNSVFTSAIPYTFRISTGDGEDNGTDSNVWVKVYGPRKKHSGKLFLELAQNNFFRPGSTEIFSIEAVEVDEVKKIEVILINWQ